MSYLVSLLNRLGVKNRCQQLIQLVSWDSLHSGLPIDQFFTHHVASNVNRSNTCAFTITGLEHVNLTFFNGEFEVLHVREVRFKRMTNRIQFSICLRHDFL